MCVINNWRHHGGIMEDIKTKATAILKDYISQMRAANFADQFIREKILKAGSITVPDKLPANFGQTWTTGMSGEFLKSLISKKGKLPTSDWVEKIPSPNDYMEYMSGYTPNRIPSYSEFAERNQPMGKFEQTRNTNLMTELQNRLQGYSGPKVGASQYAYEMGIVGLPQELANKWIPEYLELAKQKADEAKQMDEYEGLLMQYPEIDFKPGASAQENAAKIRDYYELKTYQEEAKMPSIVSALDNAVYQAIFNNETTSVEDVINTSLQLGFEITFDQANAIFESAKNRALNDLKKQG